MKRGLALFVISAVSVLAVASAILVLSTDQPPVVPSVAASPIVHGHLVLTAWTGDDPSGIFGRVRATQVVDGHDTDVVFKTTTDLTGAYQVEVPPGTYAVSASLPGMPPLGGTCTGPGPVTVTSRGVLVDLDCRPVGS